MPVAAKASVGRASPLGRETLRDARVPGAAANASPPGSEAMMGDARVTGAAANVGADPCAQILAEKAKTTSHPAKAAAKHAAAKEAAHAKSTDNYGADILQVCACVRGRGHVSVAARRARGVRCRYGLTPCRFGLSAATPDDGARQQSRRPRHRAPSRARQHQPSRRRLNRAHPSSDSPLPARSAAVASACRSWRTVVTA